jgi:hypothetical protein
MTDIQPDLFGGSTVIGASVSVQRAEADQCLGQTDVYSLISERCGDCNSTGAVPAGGWEDPADVIDGYVSCPTCERGWL